MKTVRVNAGSKGIVGALSFAFIAQTTVSLLMLTVPVLAPEIAKGRGLDVHLIALYFPILYTVAIFSNFLTPLLLPRLGGVGYSLFCIVVGAVGVLLMLPHSIALTLAVPIVLGVGNGGMTPATSQIVGPYISPRTAGLIMSVRQTALPAGGILAGFLLPAMAGLWGWHALAVTGLAGAALGVLLLPALHWLDDGSARPGSSRPLEPLKRLLAMPDMPQMMFAIFVNLMLIMCVRAFLTVYLVRDLGFGLTLGGLALAAAQFSGIPGQFVCAVVSDRWLSSRVVLAASGAVITAATLLAATFSHHWPIAAILAVVAILGFFASGTPTVMLGEIARRAQRAEVGLLVSGGNLAIMAGSAVGPLVFGAVATRFGYPGGFVAVAILTLVGAIVVAPLWARGNPSIAAEQSRP
jgi:MFS family permease